MVGAKHEAEENERRRIVRELHDEAGQSLLALRMDLELLERHAPEPMVQVHRGGSFLSPRLLNRLVDGFRSQNKTGVAPRQPRLGTLTKREREILKMLAEGKSVKEIATGFDLSVKTIEAHKFNLMRKLNIHDKAQLVHYAIQKKILRLPDPTYS
jgi:DNA-binding NarL/FixJ family response regulator